MRKTFNVITGLSLLFATGCAVQQPLQSAEQLKPGPNESLAMIVPAKGVQIYECRAGKDGAYEWTFVAPLGMSLGAPCGQSSISKGLYRGHLYGMLGP